MARSGRRGTGSNANGPSASGPNASGPNVSRRNFMAGVAVAGAARAVSSQEAARLPPRLKPTFPIRLPRGRRRCGPMRTSPPLRPAFRRPSAKPKVRTGRTSWSMSSRPSTSITSAPIRPRASAALHESLIDYGGNKKPEFITCIHEESSVGMAHGYFKATGKPMMMLCHGTVGLQHAAMAIYNAWCDRVPVIVVGGTDLDAAYRAPGVPTYHSAQDINALVRDFTKWDDQPVSLQHFAQSLVRAYKIAMTPPHEPVMLALDLGLQQEPIKAHERETLYIPKYVPTAPPQGDAGAVREAARLLANAERPVIVADRAARTPGRHPAPRRARRSAAGAGDRPGRPHEHAQHPLSQPHGARRGADRQCRRHHRPRAVGLLGGGQRVRRQRARRHRDQRNPDQARHQADRHHFDAARHQVELPGLPALPVARRRHGRATPRPRCRH